MNRIRSIYRPLWAVLSGVVLFFLGVSDTAAQESSQTLTVSWNPNSEEDLAGYRVYYGTASRRYTNVIDVGNHTYQEISGLKSGVRYYFAVTAYDLAGNESDFSEEVSAVLDEESSSMPLVFVLFQNYPNPFNPETAIPFYLPEKAKVLLQVVDTAGNIVRTLEKGVLPAGRHTAYWDGRNDQGTKVASGVYLVRFQAERIQLSRSIVLIR